jgi:hypothetical protein
MPNVCCEIRAGRSCHVIIRKQDVSPRVTLSKYGILLTDLVTLFYQLALKDKFCSEVNALSTEVRKLPTELSVRHPYDTLEPETHLNII